jgi:hypothetical protein
MISGEEWALQIEDVMAFKWFTSHTLALLLAFLVLLANHLTFAAVGCEALYSKLSSYSDTHIEITELTTATKDVVHILKDAPEMSDSKQVKSQVQNLMKKVETYFEAAEMAYKPVKAKLQIIGLSDREVFVLTYNQYQIHGSKRGDEFSRMIFGVEADSDSQTYPVNFVYDPLFQIRHNDTGATFADGKVAKISFGSDVFLARTERSNSLRHDIQHYFESVDLKKGEMTLARIQLRNSKEKKGVPYSELMGMDELETHLRDIRGLLNIPLNQKKDQRLSLLKTESQMAYIQTFRKKNLKKKIETLTALLQNSVKMCQVMKAVLPKLQTDFSRGPEVENDAIYEFDFPSGLPYESISVNLEKRIDLSVADSKQVQESLASVFEWSLKRAEEIQTELNELQAKAVQLKLIK